jgi:hypothetical protein
MTPLTCFLSFALVASATQPDARLEKSVGHVLGKFEKAFSTCNLGSFTNPTKHLIKATIIHSLIESPRGIRSRTFTSFVDLEIWLRQATASGEHGELILYPREVRPYSNIAPGLVEYDNQGISHRTLYLSQVRFIKQGPGVSITEVVFYDGD